LRDFWQSRVDETGRAEQERDEFRRLLRDYGLAKNPSEDAKRRLRLFYGVGVLDPLEGYDRRLTLFYGVTGTSASAEVSLPWSGRRRAGRAAGDGWRPPPAR